MEVAAAEVVTADARVFVEVGRGRGCEVGGAADQLRHLRREPVERLAGGGAGRDRVAAGGERRRLLQGRDVRLAPAGDPQELVGELAVLGGVGLEALVPLGLGGDTALLDALEELVDLGRDRERLLVGPAERLLGELDLFLAERSAVGGGVVLLVRAAEADVRGQDHERWPVGDRLRLLERGLDPLERGVDLEPVHRPSVRLEARPHVVVEGEIRRSLDRDRVVVVDPDQLAEAEVAGERSGLARDSLLHVAVAGDEERVVVDDLLRRPVERRREVGFGEREADGVADALAERSGRDLDPDGVAELGVPGRPALPLPELLDVVEAEVVAGEVQAGVLEHAGVAGAEDEAVATGPVRVDRVVVHDPRVEGVAERGETHRGARVAGVGLLDGVHRQRPDRVDRQLVELAGTGVARGRRLRLVAHQLSSRPFSSSLARIAAPSTPAFGPCLESLISVVVPTPGST